MIVRSHFKCLTCEHVHTLRIGLGFESRHIHTFPCAECEEEMKVAMVADQVNQTFTNCSRCLLGKYSDEMGSVHCKFCPAGSYSTKETGSIACTNCPKGTYNEDGRTVTYDDPPLCIKCEAGRYQDVDGADNILMCQECEIYTYNPFLGQASCQPCKTNLNTSSTSCSGCNPGTYLSNDGITCTTCELGLYTGELLSCCD